MSELRWSRRRRWLVVVLSILGACAVGGVAFRDRLLRDPLAPAEEAYRNEDWVMVDRLASDRLKSSPDDHRALRLRARTAARTGNDTTARALYARLGGPGAMEPEDFWLVGRVIGRLGSRETARECWTEGLRIDPNHPELLREIVLDLLETGKPIQAARFARRLVAVPGWQVRGERLLGKALAADDDPRGAAETWSHALTNDPEMNDEMIGLRKATARAWLRIGQPSRARDVLKWNATPPDDPEAAWLLNRSYLQERSVTQAEQSLAASRQYRDLHPLEPEPAPYVGSARCRDCHATVTDSLWASRHSRTFQRSPEIRIRSLPDHPIADPGIPSVHHSLRKTGGELRFETRKGDDVAAAVLAYAFGSGDRGITLVGRDDRGRTREMRLSLYENQSLWDVTAGQSSPPQGNSDSLGHVLVDDELRACFFCHTTVARSARDRIGPESADPAIGCERCHGPGAHHVAAIATGSPDPAIAQPGPRSGAEVVALCGSCHQPLGKKVTPADVLAPRFPAAGLTWSRCFIASKAEIDCLTCHDPHRDAETSPAYYEQKCLECHSERARTPVSNNATAPPESEAVVCPKRPLRGCLKCHMPIVDSIVPHTRFTDHYIRVHRD